MKNQKISSQNLPLIFSMYPEIAIYKSFKSFNELPIKTAFAFHNKEEMMKFASVYGLTDFVILKSIAGKDVYEIVHYSDSLESLDIDFMDPEGPEKNDIMCFDTDHMVYRLSVLLPEDVGFEYCE